MTEVILYIAHSIDGFIADRKGGIGWLKPYDGTDFGYDGFIRRVDAVVMGRKTYQECRSFGTWPYPGKSTVVMTKGAPVDGDGLAVFDGRSPQEILIDFEHAGRKTAWIVGGGGPIRAFLDAGLLKRLILFQMPVLLGAGTPLWPPGRKSYTATLRRTTAHEIGVVETEYEVGRTFA
jgi:dihydrofolate reductase